MPNHPDVALLCSNRQHPVWPYLQEWVNRYPGHAQLAERYQQLAPATILFLVSCSELINAEQRQRFGRVLTLHASALPEGRGWSPHIWQIVEGRNNLTLSLIDAADPVDSGNIWLQQQIALNGNELYAEINARLFAAEIALIEQFCSQHQQLHSHPQPAEGGSYYRKRTPADSQLDPDLSLRAQFNLLRVCDPERFPAYFELNGQKYLVRIEKAD